MRFDWQRLWPKYWVQNEPTNWEWDATLNDLLDKYKPIPGYMTVTLGPVEVWVSNYPYSYGRPWRPLGKFLPSVATRKRLKSAVPTEAPADPMEAIRKAVK